MSDNAPDHSVWDRLWLAMFRRGQRRVENRERLSQVQAAAQRRGDTPLSRFGKKHPLPGGIVAGVVWGAAMFMIFNVLTLFRLVYLMAALCAAGGVVFGTAMGWYWSYLRKHGRPPAF